MSFIFLSVSSHTFENSSLRLQARHKYNTASLTSFSLCITKTYITRSSVSSISQYLSKRRLNFNRIHCQIGMVFNEQRGLFVRANTQKFKPDYTHGSCKILAGMIVVLDESIVHFLFLVFSNIKKKKSTYINMWFKIKHTFLHYMCMYTGVWAERMCAHVQVCTCWYSLHKIFIPRLNFSSANHFV